MKNLNIKYKQKIKDQINIKNYILKKHLNTHKISFLKKIKKINQDI
jgi:hypothetical protein